MLKDLTRSASHLLATATTSLRLNRMLAGLLLPAALLALSGLTLTFVPIGQIPFWLPLAGLPLVLRLSPSQRLATLIIFILGASTLLVRHGLGQWPDGTIPRLAGVATAQSLLAAFVLAAATTRLGKMPLPGQYIAGILIAGVSSFAMAWSLTAPHQHIAMAALAWFAALALPSLAGLHLWHPAPIAPPEIRPKLLFWVPALLFTLFVQHQWPGQTGFLSAILMVGGIVGVPVPTARKLVALTALSSAYVQTAYLHGGEPAMALAWIEQTILLALSLHVLRIRKSRDTALGQLESEVQARTQQLHTINEALNEEIRHSRQAEERYQTAYRKLRALFDASPVPILVADKTLSLLQVNQAARTLLFGNGETPESLTRLLESAQQNTLLQHVRKVLGEPGSQRCMDLSVTTDDGKRLLRWTIAGYPDESSGHEAVILVGTDMTEVRDNQERLFYLAHYDPLTETANRRLLEERCRQTLKQIQRHGGRMALINLDLDHFKRINDSLGHDAGDQLLKTIAKRLKKALREEDTVSRLGGDEFVVVLHRVDGPSGAYKVAQNLLDAIREPVSLGNQTFTVSGSMGIALAPLDSMTYSGLLKCADMAMYAAKKAGRNRIALYAPHMNESLQAQMKLEQALQVAVEKQHFMLCYHPIVDITSHRIVALEALLRWKHPDGRLLAPREFLDTADNMGLLSHIADWALQNVCLQARLISHVAGQPVRVSLNVSARQIMEGSLLSAVSRALAMTRVDPRLIAIELKESSLASHPADVREALTSLKHMGVDVILDSFGDGLSNLAELVQLPFRAVKIGRRLVKALPGDELATTLVDTLITVAGKTGQLIMAEGIELPEQEAWFRERQVRLLQGYLYCKPVFQDDIAAFFRQNESGYLFRAGQYDLPLPARDTD